MKIPVHLNRSRNDMERKIRIAEHKAAERKTRKIEIIEWIRWGVTAIIAIAALVNSILARIG